MGPGFLSQFATLCRIGLGWLGSWRLQFLGIQLLHGSPAKKWGLISLISEPCLSRKLAPPAVWFAWGDLEVPRESEAGPSSSVSEILFLHIVLLLSSSPSSSSIFFSIFVYPYFCEALLSPFFVPYETLAHPLLKLHTSFLKASYENCGKTCCKPI